MGSLPNFCAPEVWSQNAFTTVQVATAPPFGQALSNPVRRMSLTESVVVAVDIL